MLCTSCDFVQDITCTKICTCYNWYNAKIQVITCTKYCLNMVLTCSIPYFSRVPAVNNLYCFKGVL